MLNFCLLAAAVLTNAVQVSEAIHRGRVGQSFDLVGQVTFDFDLLGNSFVLKDDSGSLLISYQKNSPGDFPFTTYEIVRVSGTTVLNENSQRLEPFSHSISFVRHATRPLPHSLTGVQLETGNYDLQLVKITGLVQDVFKDDIDNYHYWMSIDTPNGLALSVIPSTTNILPTIRKLIGSNVSAMGLCTVNGGCTRILLGPIINLKGEKDIKILKQRRQDLFNAPELSPKKDSAPSVNRLGHRKIRGSVVCRWRPNTCLVRTPAGTLHNVEISDTTLPIIGEFIEIIGLPETDLYRINLTHASWRPCKQVETAGQSDPVPISVHALINDPERPQSGISASNHGTPVCFSGEVVNLQDKDSQAPSFCVRSDDRIWNVDASACPSIAKNLHVGSKVRISGIFIVQTESWRQNRPLPRIYNVLIAIRTPSDIVILSQPSWWTAQRLLWSVITLLALLIGFFIWNRFLNRLAKRRGRQLLKEEIAHEKSISLTEERTRLAIELHDTISQDLTGVALKLDAIELSIESGSDKTMGLVHAVQLALMNCRKSLRDCLWNLQNRAYEEKDLTDALHRVLDPHVGQIKLTVDCSASCSDFSNNSLHHVLGICRELAVNAIRHGKPQTLSIRGSLADGRLELTVSDDGCGFDPRLCAGPSDGHFGLNGVAERVRRLGGTITIDSARGKGSVFTITGLKTDI